ncbi:unnamed protein product [Ceratitis capitata]|uniref:(Mediterranean fruit fly) hypothetical protein n=1 Tax=Ceratitis capitata TaxID=7213 RepID=A0A811UJ43_CERCA|nr:unnamed protein product [Ceratitis capitata]
MQDIHIITQRNICTSVLPVCSSSQPAPCQRWATQFFTNTKVTNFLDAAIIQVKQTTSCRPAQAQREQQHRIQLA